MPRSPVPGRAVTLILTLLALFLNSPLAAQVGEGAEDRAAQAIRESAIFGTDEDFTYSYDFFDSETSEDFSQLAAILLGNVVLEGRGFSLHADAVGFFVEGFDEDGRPKNARVFADGNILLVRGDQSFRAETLLIDVESRRAVFTRTRLRIDQALIERLRATPISDPQRSREILDAFAPGPIETRVRGAGTPIVFAAEELRVEDFERIEGRGIEFTTCEFGHPHWSLRAESGTAEKRKEIDPEPGEVDPGGWLFELDSVWLHAGPVAIPVLPGVVFDSRWGRYVPLRSVSYSKSSKFGNRIDTLWDGNLLLPESLSREMDLSLRLDYLEDRGTGYGTDLEYGRDPLRWAIEPDGRVDLYGYGQWWAIRDRGEDRNGTRPNDPDRQRTRWHQRMRLQTGTWLDFEYAVESDRNFLDEYYEDEARGEKTPENLIYLRQPVATAGMVTMQAQRRLVPYRTVLEKLPEMKFFWVEEEEPWSGIILDGEAAIATLHERPDDDLLLPDRETQRGDFRLRGARPLQITRGLRLRPFVGTRYTVWDENLVGDEEDRLAWSGGATLSSRFWRTFGTRVPALDIDGLRHVVDFDVTFASIFETNVEPSELIVLDEVDQIMEREQVTLSLKQRLFTRRGKFGREARRGYDVRSLVDTRLAIDWFPDKKRDNAGESWSPIAGEVLVTPIDHFGIFVDGEYDFADGDLDEMNAGFRFFDYRALLLEISNRFRKGQQDSINLGGRWWGSARYEFGVFTEYDLRRNRASNQKYSIVRNFHRWSMAFSVEVDEGERDDTTFRIDFGPRDLLGWNRKPTE